MNPGIYPGLPMSEYLQIDALSVTPVRKLVDECPRAGWWASRLNPNRPPHEESADMDLGSIAHSVFLEGSWDCVAIIDPANYPSKTKPFNVPRGWTNDAIREARDAARAAGKYPILPGAKADVEAMVVRVREFVGSLEHTEPAIWRAFQPDGGASEVTMVWEDDGLLCKMRADRISADYSIVIDYKTSGMSVEPDRFGRTQLYGGMSYAFSAAWYRRGVRALFGTDPDYLFLAQETEPPHLCSLVGMDPPGLALAEEKVAAGLNKWRECLRTGQWDGYPNRACYPLLPVYERIRWDERVVVGKDGIDYGSQA